MYKCIIDPYVSFCTYYTSVSQHKIFLCRFTPPHSKKVPHLSSISSPVSTARGVIVDTYDYVPAMIHFPMATALDGAIAETHTTSASYNRPRL